MPSSPGPHGRPGRVGQCANSLNWSTGAGIPSLFERLSSVMALLDRAARLDRGRVPSRLHAPAHREESHRQGAAGATARPSAVDRGAVRWHLAAHLAPPGVWFYPARVSLRAALAALAATAVRSLGSAL